MRTTLLLKSRCHQHHIQRDVIPRLLHRTTNNNNNILHHHHHQIRKYSTTNATTTTGTTPFTWQDSSEDDSIQYDPSQVFHSGMRHHHICNTAWPIAHNETIRPYHVKRVQDQHDIRKVLYGAYGDRKDMMLYAHVPFCQTRCQFCEYTVVDPKQGKVEGVQDTYFDAMADEFRLYDELLNTRQKKLVGFDIGGGTPSMASIKQIDRVMTLAHKHYQLDTNAVEVSIETTPKIAAAEPEKIIAYHRMGIRRISMGLQTTDFRQAKDLGRDDANASTDYLHKAVDNIRRAGFKSFNIDLMYGFPLVQRKDYEDPWPQTVRDTVALAPEHITLYRMRYKGTKMAHLADRVNLAQVNQQEGTAREILTSLGYAGMVGKNTYSRMEKSSGCSDYLDLRVVKAVPYIGVGLGAQSFSHHTLQYNLGAVTKHLGQYVKSLELGRLPIQDLYHLSKSAAIAKMVSVSFYFGGIDLAAFEECFHVRLEDAFPLEVAFLQRLGLMVYDGNGRFQLTAIGKKHFGGVVALFYSPAVKKHIMNRPGGEIFDEDPLEVLERRARLTDTSASQSSSSSTSGAYKRATVQGM